MSTLSTTVALKSNDLAEMQRAACSPDGSTLLMSWLARRLGGAVGLVFDGRVRWHTPGDNTPTGLPKTLTPSASATAGGTKDASDIPAVPVPGWDARLMRLGAFAVVAARRRRRSTDAPWDKADDALLHAAGNLLRLRLAEEEAARSRQAVFQLLMDGHTEPLRQLLANSGVSAPDTVSVVLVECDPDRREEIVRTAGAATKGLWVRCPAFRNHVIGVIDAQPDRTDAAAVDAVRRACSGLLTAAGGAVRLDQVAAGYEQAWATLALTKHSQNLDGPVRGSALADLAAALGAHGAAWARARLAPLLEGAQGRPDERIRTLTAWLAYGPAGAAGVLHVHRNALTGSNGRIPRIRALLGEDLGRLDVRAELSLALRLYGPDCGGCGGTPPALSELLASEPARAWAAGLLAPLEDAGHLDWVRAWTMADGNKSAAARELGVTASALHGRLHRAEAALGMVLVSGDDKAVGLTARYPLYLAFRATSS